MLKKILGVSCSCHQLELGVFINIVVRLWFCYERELHLFELNLDDKLILEYLLKGLIVSEIIITKYIS